MTGESNEINSLGARAELVSEYGVHPAVNKDHDTTKKKTNLVECYRKKVCNLFTAGCQTFVYCISTGKSLFN